MNKKQTKLLSEINEQKDWIHQCGGTLLGYLKKYGDAGDGGRAIHKADMNALFKLEEELRKVKDSLLSNGRS